MSQTAPWRGPHPGQKLMCPAQQAAATRWAGVGPEEEPSLVTLALADTLTACL